MRLHPAVLPRLAAPNGYTRHELPCIGSRERVLSWWHAAARSGGCYNDARYAQGRSEKYGALPRSTKGVRLPAPIVEASGRTKETRDTLSTGTTYQPRGRPQHNLPAPRNSFVGRKQQIEEVGRELASTRLLTLTGAGGSGKTRLALEVARDLLEAYPEGVWLVQLAPLSEGELVTRAAAKALRVPERPEEPLADTLAEVLRDMQLLLILDNCEHLLEASARLVDKLLDSCPRLRIMATSREALGVEGEAKWLVPPLSVPEMGRARSLEELERSESVRLFVERARRQDRTFSLSQQNAVAEICRRLDGIPLAIELAAARVGTLSVEQISERLEGSLELLTHGGRTAARRQRTLRGTLEWSYDLLSEVERVLFMRLSVFAGGWTLEAAEAVGSGSGIEKVNVLELLSRLVDKSLVVAEATRDGSMHHRLLQPIRQYAREKLKESGEAGAVDRRHALYFLAVAEEAEPGLEGAQQLRWLERLDEGHDNIRAALSWSLGQGEDTELGLRMGAALGEFWYLRGYLDEGRRWLEEALAKSGQTPARARALQRVSLLAIYQGDFDRAEGASEEGLDLAGVELFRTGGGDSVAAELQRTLGLAVAHRGELERATEIFEEGLALSREAGNSRGMAISLRRLGMAWRGRSDIGRATQFYEQALELCRESGDPSLLASILIHLGITFLFRGELERATALSEEAAAIFREQNHLTYLAMALDYLGLAALLRGDVERAGSLLAESLGLQREVGDKPAASESLAGLACVAEARGKTRRAAKLFGAAEMLREMTSFQQEAGDRALQEPYLSAARSRLAEASWEAAWSEGRKMSFEDAIEYALSAKEHPAAQSSAAFTQAPDHPAGLTPREVEVLEQVARGMTSAQIANSLFLSPRTVHTHLNSIYHKIGVNSRSAATRFALEHDLA
jgi:predicted ATPase/DNA-binding CsgD family transcriptional regulator